MNVRRILIASCIAFAPLAARSQTSATDSEWASAEAVTVKLSSFQFDPAIVTLRQGRAYVLRLENTSSGGHDFAAKEFFGAARIQEGDRAKAAGGKIRLDGGKSVEIHLIAPGAGTYKVRCTHFLHAGFGMTGEIVVQ